MRIKSKRKENISTIFLLPGIALKQELKNKFRENGFINSYMVCDTYYHHGEFRPIYILFKPKEFNLSFYSFTLAMEKNQNFVESIDIPNGLVFVFKFPKRFVSDYTFIKKGQYSRLSPEYKKLFPMYRLDKDNVKVPSFFNQIFNRSEELIQKYRDFYGDVELPYELYTRPTREEETLIIQNC